ncbi:MAG: YraN family protein [Clostridium sp.]
MKCFNKSIGSYGETLAESHLKCLGYTILHKNFTCSLGEIDIVCRKDNIICFVEVKSRFSNTFGHPCEAINYKKRIQLLKLSKYYIHKFNLRNFNYRFDALEVSFDMNYSTPIINFITDAFRFY